jgi:hypothetical protein
LARLPPLVAAGVLTPAQSNAMQTVCKTLLEYLREDGDAKAFLGNAATIREAVRKTPELLSVIAPLLSPDQLTEFVDDDDCGDGGSDPDQP